MKWKSREEVGRELSQEGASRAGVFRPLDESSAPSSAGGKQCHAAAGKPDKEKLHGAESVKTAMSPTLAHALGRSVSPESSSNGSSFNLSETSLRATPLGSTTGLIDNPRRSARVKVGYHWMPTLGSVLAVLSLTAGLGNIVRLPQMVVLNGGGPFLIVYICIMLIFGIPLTFLEIGLGQFCQEGTTKLWRAVPLFKGVGFVKILTSFLAALYYPVLMALSLFYFVWCVKGPVPFSECILKHDFGGPIYYNSSEACLKDTFLKPYNDEFMWFGVNIAFLFLLWALCMLCVFKNKHSYRIAAAFILIPVVFCIIALLFNAVLKDPSAVGLKLLFTFEWSILLDIKVWYFATLQMFFSTQLGFGSITTCAGKLYSKHNAFWTAVYYVIVNLIIGTTTVIIVYQWIGQLELKQYSQSTEDPLTTIPEAFIYTLTYNVATYCKESLDRHWSALVYFVLTSSGFASMIPLLYTITVSIIMELKKWEWWYVTGFVCAVGFVMGSCSLLSPQLQIVHIMDHYVIGRMAVASTALEVAGFSWIYGSGNLYNDFEFILGQKLNRIWKYLWFITPFGLLVLEVWSYIKLPLNGLNGQDPFWVFLMGWCLYALTFVIVICTAFYQVLSQVDYNIAQKFLSSLKPSRNWGPVDTITRHRWVRWKDWSYKGGHRDFSLKRQGTKDYTTSIRKGTTPLAIYRTTVGNGTAQNSRAVDKGPFKIQANGTEHVCWRGTVSMDHS